MNSPSKILVPVDFSKSSRSALDFAAALGARLGAEVDVLHVWEPGHPGASPNDLLLDFVRSEPGHTMKEWLASFEKRGDVETHGRLAAGAHSEVPDTIVETVQSGAYDLVVMATHGRHGLSLLWRASITDEVMRRAPCPVVTVRATDDEGPSELDASGDDMWVWPS